MTTVVYEKNAVTNSLLYRPDIDGLRAVAVLAVVAFHAFPSLLPGGFVGVDIFFVISGFLITNILLSEMQAGRFSIARFYVRRIRRIFPALALVLIFTYALGWFSLFKGEYRQLGKHIAAGAGFVANLAFWNEAGYFDNTADTKPLLHLWSLGVEEQFYIIWPLLLLLACRLRANLIGWMVAGLFVSFCGNVLLVAHHPAAAFFSPLSRFWELLVGALLAQWNRTQFPSDGATANRMSLVGAALCVLAMFGLNKDVDFPGWWALLPSVGAALLIAGGDIGFTNRRVLSNPLMVWVGKISYPLYLWHWPLLSFATILAGQTPEPHVRVALVEISVLLAWLTYVVVEKPVRFGAHHPAKLVVPCILLVAMGYVGGMTYARDGLGFRKGYSLTADVNSATLGAGHESVNPECGVPVADQHLFQFCAKDRREPPRAIVWGDSKADALYWGLVRESESGQRWSLIARTSCAPMSDFVRISSYAKDDPEQCAQANRVAMKTITGDRDADLVVLVTAARVLVGQEYAKAETRTVDQSGALDGLDDTVTALQQAGKKVAIVMDNPTLPDPRECMDRKLMGFPVVRELLSASGAGSAASKCSIPYAAYLASTLEYRALIAKLRAMHPDVLIFDPSTVLCDTQKGVCSITRNGKYLYSYGDHISDTANGLIADQVLAELHGTHQREPQQ
ncbi:acyltransferase [Burkholderia sp. R-70211]|nr:acyltransferase [Burkholderia sp. R-70211]